MCTHERAAVSQQLPRTARRGLVSSIEVQLAVLLTAMLRAAARQQLPRIARRQYMSAYLGAYESNGA